VQSAHPQKSKEVRLIVIPAINRSMWSGHT
jgi:hypothetical protein